MQKYPKITIITPNFNGAAYLEATICSVLDQNYPNLEYLIFDGASTDESCEIIKKYESKIHFWTSEKDKGQSDAINKGLQRASGDWVAFLNSDDLYKENALFTVAEAALKNPEADWLVGKTEIFGNNGDIYRTRAVTFHPQTKPSFWIDYRADCPQQSTFLSRKLVQQVGLFNSDFHFAFDTEYWFRAHLNGFSPKSIPEILAQFRFHTTSKTAQSRIPFLEEHKRFLENPMLQVSDLERTEIIKELDRLEALDRISRVAENEHPFQELWSVFKKNPEMITNRMFLGAIKKQLLHG